MKVKIIRPTIAQKRNVTPGEILDVPQHEAVQLIGAGKAVAVKESAVETAERPMDVVETSDAPAAQDVPEAPEQEDAEVKRPRGRTKKAGEQ
jgi:hypothetical protein